MMTELRANFGSIFTTLRQGAVSSVKCEPEISQTQVPVQEWCILKSKQCRRPSMSSKIQETVCQSSFVYVKCLMPGPVILVCSLS